MRVAEATQGHIGTAVRALLAAGWRISHAPAHGRLLRNRQLITLEEGDRTVTLRLLAYKVTKSSRGRARERRVEITSTYGHGIEPLTGINDVVVGFHAPTRTFVGLDPVRLQHGGKTSNASSFVEPEGLHRTDDFPFVVLSRQTHIFPKGELQAFFRPEYLSAYLGNFASIHNGGYPIHAVEDRRPLLAGWTKMPFGKLADRNCSGDRLILTRDRPSRHRSLHLTNRAKDIADRAIDLKRLPHDVSPQQLQAIQQRQAENGLLGEQFVYEYERTTLRKQGKAKLANRVEWVSKRTVSAGYDIKSFDARTGEQRYIEVKSCHTPTSSFYATQHEWSTAERLGEQFAIYRVVNVRDRARIQHKFRNPRKLERKGRLKISPVNWKVTIVGSRD